ncbi:MAG: polymerase subunit sigma [Daejeonella sp.]|nr:polymerase subunit sigma [Daejeonella sp.]
MTRTQFNKLVIAEAKSLGKYAMHFTRDTDDANDLVQDTMLKAISSAGRFQEGTNLKGWLFTILKNTYINNYKKHVKKNQIVTQSDEVHSHHLMFSATRNNSESKFIMDDLNRALTQLPQEYESPFTMYFEGYKYHEIADHLVIPIGTVKTRIFVARRILKKSLKPYNHLEKSQLSKCYV